MRKSGLVLVILVLTIVTVRSQEVVKLDREQAGRLSRLAYKCIHTEYANNLQHSMQSDKDLGTPSQLHPVFYGCYDWHSSVHGHWLLVKLLKEFPDLQARDSIIQAIDMTLTAENIAAEIAYFKAPDRISYERPYGWGWLLKLTAELATWDHPLGEKWYGTLKPLAGQIVQNYKTYLPGLYYPLRRGVHANTAFGLSLALDYARVVGDKEFETLLLERSRFYFMKDHQVPAAWEPDGDDFLSPSLIEANLMRRVLPGDEFQKWFAGFLPEIPASLKHPAVVANRADPTGVHLDGLNLSRAWCMFELAKALPAGNPMAKELQVIATEHAKDALPHVISENYLGTHWLATFAVYMYYAR